MVLAVAAAYGAFGAVVLPDAVAGCDVMSRARNEGMVALFAIFNRDGYTSEIGGLNFEYSFVHGDKMADVEMKSKNKFSLILHWIVSRSVSGVYVSWH